MDDREIEAFYDLTLAVRRLFHKLGHGFGQLHGESEISIGMRAVLESVIDGGPQTVPQMARVRPVTRQHIQSLVNALLEGGFVEYRDNPGHKRSKLVAATPRGETAFAAMRAVENRAFRALTLPDVGARDLQTANRVLRRIIAAFDSEDWPPRPNKERES